MRPLIWLGALPVGGAALAHLVAYATGDRPRDFGDVLAPALVIAAVLAWVVARWAARSGAPRDAAWWWGLGAATITLALCAAPILLFITTCGDCLQ
jgi:hypothetical protein